MFTCCIYSKGLLYRKCRNFEYATVKKQQKPLVGVNKRTDVHQRRHVGSADKSKAFNELQVTVRGGNQYTLTWSRNVLTIYAGRMQGSKGPKGPHTEKTQSRWSRAASPHPTIPLLPTFQGTWLHIVTPFHPASSASQPSSPCLPLCTGALKLWCPHLYTDHQSPPARW